jgi:hypothetical protein
MPEPDLFRLFVQPLNEHEIRYSVCGSVAAMLYGEPRFTLDIDMMVMLRREDISRLGSAFPENDFYLPPPEVIASELERGHNAQLNVIHSSSSLKADFFLFTGDPFDLWAYRNSRQYEIEGMSVRVAPPENVIVRKLEYYREGGSDKHLRDIRSMLLVSDELIDRSSLNEWIQRRGVGEQWKLVEARS